MDYTKRAALLCCTCYIVLVAVSFIPPLSACGVETRRANILSEIIIWDRDEPDAAAAEVTVDNDDYTVDFERVDFEIEQVASLEQSPSQVERSFSWPTSDQVASDKPFTPRIDTASSTLLKGVELTPIEDFDSTGISRLERFYTKLLSPDSLVRIAVLGDSFIEADIITADLREALQSRYGGCGAGFAPMHSPLTTYRSTIKTDAKGWSSYNVMQHKKTPSPYNTLFSVSGWVSVPEAQGASTSWGTTSARKFIDSCNCVRLHFLSHEASSIEVRLNHEQSHTFDIEGGELLRQIEMQHPGIHSVEMRLKSGQKGFVGYGAFFEGTKGVALDNFSVRSNNGQAMFWTSPAINAQIDQAVGGYDLVILQYGLNIMQSGVTKYSAYGKNVEKMIAYSRKCFPKAAILVLGVSDRSAKKDGSFHPMSEAKELSSYQREAAKSQGAAFWSIYDAMQRQGSMSKFVSNGWAAKDFTHINLKGGRQVAYALFDAIESEVERVKKGRVVKIDHQPIIDPEGDQTINRELLTTGQSVQHEAPNGKR